MSKRARPTEDEIKRVLAAKKRPRGKGACYPCNHRKVKCDMNKPCSTCLKRNHPDICVYSREPESGSSLEPENEYPPTHQIISPAELTHGTHPAEASTTEVSGNSSSFLGEHSAASYLRQMGGAESPIAREIVPALGLRNTLGQYPFINAETEDEKTRELEKLLPTNQETLTFYQVYRTISFHLSPLIVDIEQFESHLADYLERSAGSDRTPPTITFEKERAARTALLLATLAAGAQYSDRTAEERRKISRNFAKRSFHALRLANFLLRPLLTSLQALLILGTFLQNDGNSDAAWALLGTTMRLAQSLGLHSEYGVAESTTENEKDLRRRLWMTIVQQDCILSLCYDRPTALAYMPFGLVSGRNHKLNHQEVMWEISRLGLTLLANRDSEANVESMQRQLRDLQQAMLNSVEHLQNREKCKDLQERIEFFSISLHKAFLTAAVCRPTFRKRPQQDYDMEYLNLLSTGKKALESAVKAFLNLGSLTIYPTRSWICIHEALSSALLLTILGETRSSKSLKNMQKKLIDVLLSNAQDESPRLNHALTSSHLKALMTLQSLTQETPQRPVVYSRPPYHQTIDPPVPRALDSGDTAVSQSEGLGAASNDSIFENLQSDLSPMAFLDSIIWDKSFPEEDTAFLGFDFGE